MLSANRRLHSEPLFGAVVGEMAISRQLSQRLRLNGKAIYRI